MCELGLYDFRKKGFLLIDRKTTPFNKIIKILILTKRQVSLM